MAHLRQQIRERVATTLTGLTTTGSNVFQNRIYPQTESNLPCLLIYTLEERPAPFGPGNASRLIRRELRLAVEAMAQATSDLDDTLDTIAKEVEVALANDFTLNGLAHDLELNDTLIRYNDAARQATALMTMVFRITYFNEENDPETRT